MCSTNTLAVKELTLRILIWLLMIVRLIYNISYITCIGKRYLFHVAHTSVMTHCLCRFWLACLQLNTVVHKVTFKTWIWKRFYPYSAHKGVCLCIDLGAGESRGGRPGLSVLTSLLVSVDVKLYWTMLWHWSQLVPNMSADIQRH